MNQLAKSLIGRLFGATLLPFLLRRKLVIFTFHRVLTTQEYANCRFEKSITVTDTGLASFLHHIKQHFDIIPLSQLIVESHNSPSENNKPQAANEQCIMEHLNGDSCQRFAFTDDNCTC